MFVQAGSGTTESFFELTHTGSRNEALPKLLGRELLRVDMAETNSDEAFLHNLPSLRSNDTGFSVA